MFILYTSCCAEQNNITFSAMEGKCWDAYVLYFCSLKKFFIQNKSDLQKMQVMSTYLQGIADKLSTIVCANPGDIVAAKYVTDGLWYRAKIISIEEGTYIVQFIDYGNIELSSNLKQLPEHLASCSPMAYHCMLDDVDEEEQVIITKSEIYDIVFEFITSTELIVTFLSNEEPFLVNIEWDNRNIKTFLNNIISYGTTFKTYNTLKEFDKLGVKMKVNLIYIESLNEFYVETENSEEIKNKINRELENRLVWKPVIECKIGKLVISKCETNNKWYRVRILEIHDDGKCTCYLIDYGIKEICSEFYEAVGYLELTPPFIKRCSLHMPNIKNKILFANISKSFIDEMALCKDKKMFITIVLTGEPWVVELYVDELNIVDVIEPKPVIVINVFHINALTVQVNTPGRRAVIEKLNNIKTLPVAKKPNIGQIYGAYVSKQWYRVKLKRKFNKQSMEVCMVDIGSSLFEVQELFVLPSCIANIKYLSVHCSLRLDERYFSSTKLRLLCSNDQTEFTMIVIENNYIKGHHISLLLDNKDVMEMIKKD